MVRTQVRGTAYPPLPGDSKFHFAASIRLTSDDQLAGERIYYDRATVFAQLGVFREPVGLFGRVALALNHPLIIGRSLLRSVWD